jgi:hypothetical protein
MHPIYFLLALQSSGSIKVKRVIRMKLSKSSKADLSKYLMYGAVLAVLFAGEAWIGPDIWLAATQWLLVALVLIAFAIYLKLA